MIQELTVEKHDQGGHNMQAVDQRRRLLEYCVAASH
jgi:hypothetical protein